MGYWQPQSFNLVREKLEYYSMQFELSNAETGYIQLTGTGILHYAIFEMDNAGVGDCTTDIWRDGVLLNKIVTGGYRQMTYTAAAWWGYSEYSYPWRYWEVGAPADRYVIEYIPHNGMLFNTSLRAAMMGAIGMANVVCNINLICEGNNLTMTYNDPT